MKRTAVSLIVLAFIITLNTFAIFSMKNLSKNKATYEMTADGVRCTYVDSDSEIFKSGMQIGDIILMIDGKRIVNKDYMYNRVIEASKPGDTLTYRVLRSSDTLDLKVVMEPFYSSFKIVEYFSASVLFSVLSAAVLILFPPTKTIFDIYSLFNVLAMMIVYFHVPFGSMYLYLIMIFLSYLLLHFLIDFTYVYLIQVGRKAVFAGLKLAGFAATLFWAVRYILWINGMNQPLYSALMNSLKLFQLFASVTVIFCSIMVTYKLLKVSSSEMPSEYIATTALILTFMLPYPLFYALPLILRRRELISFDVFFQSYALLLILLLCFRRKVRRIFL